MVQFSFIYLMDAIYFGLRRLVSIYSENLLVHNTSCILHVDSVVLLCILAANDILFDQSRS